MIVTDYKVIRTDASHLENCLNNYYQDFPHYHLYQILPNHGYHETSFMVVLEHDDAKGVKNYRHFTPEEVHKMTPKEVKANYDDIVQSMKEW